MLSRIGLRALVISAEELFPVALLICVIVEIVACSPSIRSSIDLHSDFHFSIYTSGFGWSLSPCRLPPRGARCDDAVPIVPQICDRGPTRGLASGGVFRGGSRAARGTMARRR